MIDLVPVSAEMPTTIKHYLFQMGYEGGETANLIDKLIAKFTTK
jgi:hypothetical protein